MILFVSDMHLGRKGLEIEKKEEAELIAFLRAYQDVVQHLYLLGDVFDQYIEYRHLAPKGFVRFQGLLASWTDQGIPVTYLTGNHDPWHLNYFQHELGVRMVAGALAEPLAGKQVYMTHGDAVASRFPLYAWIKRVLQHPLPVHLYRTLLPPDAGYFLAQSVRRRVHTDVINQQVVNALRSYAQNLLEKNPHDVAIMGHSHRAECIRWPFGTYVNTGCWRLYRTFAVLDDRGIELQRWTGSRREVQVITSWPP